MRQREEALTARAHLAMLQPLRTIATAAEAGPRSGHPPPERHQNLPRQR